MAHIKVTKHVCDLCGNDGYQQECILCGREFCLLCKKQSVFGHDICKDCAKRPDYKTLFEKFLKQYRSYSDLEIKKLGRLPKFKPKICGRCESAFPKLFTFRHRNQIFKSCELCRDVIKGRVHEPSER